MCLKANQDSRNRPRMIFRNEFLTFCLDWSSVTWRFEAVRNLLGTIRNRSELFELPTSEPFQPVQNCSEPLGLQKFKLEVQMSFQCSMVEHQLLKVVQFFYIANREDPLDRVDCSGCNLPSLRSLAIVGHHWWNINSRDPHSTVIRRISLWISLWTLLWTSL